MKSFQSRVWNLMKDQVFLNDSIHDRYEFIIIFEAYGPVFIIVRIYIGRVLKKLPF